MSADNGIYIVQFPDGYRVTHAQAIENIDYYNPGTKERKEILKDYFSESPLFKTTEKAFEYAKEINEEILKDDFCPIVEYGICYLGEYESFD